MADRKMQVERGNLAPYIVVNRDAAVAGVFSVDGEKGAVNLEKKYAKVSDINSSNQEINKLKPRVSALESDLTEANVKIDLNKSKIDKIDSTVDKIDSSSIVFNKNVLSKEVGVGYPRPTTGLSPISRFGYHSSTSSTPRLYMEDGTNSATLQYVMENGIVSTREWSNSQFIPSGNHANTGGVDSSGNGSINFANGLGRLYRTSDGTMTIYSRPSEGANYSTAFQIPVTNGNVMAADRLWVADNYLPCKREGVTSLPGTMERCTWSATGNALSYAKGINFGYPGSSNSDTGQLYIGYNGRGYLYFLNSGSNGGKFGGELAIIGVSAVADGNGFLKKASPVVKIFKYGDFETNDESDGAKVRHIAKGVYKIYNVLGMNSDGAWGGSNGGIEIPTDNNKQPRLWVDYDIEPNGDITIKTYHREHTNSPVFAQNKIEGYKDGDPINIPSDTFISVRVQMPENSKWNTKQKEIEELNKELDNGKEILNSDNQD